MSDYKCLCDTPCTVCGTLYFDDVTLEERTDCEHQIPMPTWHEFLTEEQVEAMKSDVAPHGTCAVLRDPRVETDTNNSDLADE